mmetsp:Transcript_37600/g.100053  ORF Transcript_37600/g.100053 Transcript_37600/m.100053 type:complete len:180 (-) Transcript_37600:109-648(-)
MAEERAEKRKREQEEGGDSTGKAKEEEKNRSLNVTLEQAEAMEKKQNKKEKGKAAFGWDIFNQDSLYKAHKKRVARVPVDRAAYEEAKEKDPDFYRDADSLAFGGTGYQPTKERLDVMVNELLDCHEKRNKFSRRRPENPEAGVDYINDRNKHFNKKIERAYGEFTKVIKENLERGTAL